MIDHSFGVGADLGDRVNFDRRARLELRGFHHKHAAFIAVDDVAVLSAAWQAWNAGALGVIAFKAVTFRRAVIRHAMFFLVRDAVPCR